MTKHSRWITVLSNSDADIEAGRDMIGWVGVSEATIDEFSSGVLHGRRVDVDQWCTADSACHGPAKR